MNNEFLEEIKFDPKDLLDPRVCNGQDLVPNILRTLGANEDVVNNPQFIEKINIQFKRIAEQSGIEIPDYNELPTRETINAIVEAVKTNGIVASQDIYKKYSEVGLKDNKRYIGINIDPKTGAVTIQELEMSGSESHVLSGNRVLEETFMPDGKGNVIENGTYYNIDSNTILKETRLSRITKVVYNPDGIKMKAEVKSYKQENGQDTLRSHSLSTRDEQFPFIAQEETFVNGFPEETKYSAIAMKDLAELGIPEYLKDEKGNPTKPITFENREQIIEYYQKNKETIDNALSQEPVHGLFPSKRLSEALGKGIKRLAVKAGLLPDEREQENEIAE